MIKSTSHRFYSIPIGWRFGLVGYVLLQGTLERYIVVVGLECLNNDPAKHHKQQVNWYD